MRIMILLQQYRLVDDKLYRLEAWEYELNAVLHIYGLWTCKYNEFNKKRKNIGTWSINSTYLLKLLFR